MLPFYWLRGGDRRFWHGQAGGGGSDASGPQASLAATSAGKTQYLLPPRRVICSYEPGNYTLYRGQTFDVVNATPTLLILYVAARQNNYTLVDASAFAGAGFEGARVAGRLRWVSDTRLEKTQRLLILAGGSQAVTPPTTDGAYVTVCKELEVDGASRDVLVGDVDRFVKRADRLTFEPAPAP